MSTHPLTIQRLAEMQREFEKKYPPSAFDKGADMSLATFDVLRRTLGMDFFLATKVLLGLNHTNKDL
jgi:hypothetical protein